METNNMAQLDRIRSNPLATEKIRKLILKYSLPCVVSMLVNSVYNIVDQIFIGQKIGYLGNAATNVAFPLVTLSLAVALLIGDGCAANLSLRLGEGRKQEAEKGFGNAVTAAIIAGVVFLIAGLCFLNPLLRLFGATDVVMPLAVDYTSITIIGLPFVIFSTVMNSSIRADGSPKYAMTTMLIGAVINVILDPLFIFTFDMGVKGAALATIIGQFVSFLFAVRYLRHMKSIRFKKENMKLSFHACRMFLPLGISSFITQMAITLVQIVLNNTLTYYGALSPYGSEIPLSALGIVMKVNQILMSVLIGVAVGSQPVFGYNYGAKNYLRVKKAYLAAVSITTVFSLLGFLLFQFCPQAIISLFGQENALYNEFAKKCFKIFLLCCLFTGFQTTSSIFFQAIGKPIKSTLLSLSRQVIFLIPLILLLPLSMGIEGALYAGPVSDSLAALLAAVFILFEMTHLTKRHKAHGAPILPETCSVE